MPVAVPHTAERSKRAVFVSQAIVLLGIAIMSAWLSWASVQKVTVFDWYSADLGNMWQSVWNVAHGNGFTYTDSGLSSNVPRLAAHADYFLLLFVPLVWIFERPEVLLITQAIVAMTGAWFVWRLAIHWLRDPWLALGLAGLYMVYGPLQFAVLWQFHAVTLSVTFVLALAESIVARRRGWLVWLWFVLAVTTKEQVGILAGIMSWILCRMYGQPKRGWLLLGAGLWFSLWHFLVIIPAHRAARLPHLFWNYYFGDLGGSTGEQVRVLFTPTTWLHQLIRADLFRSAMFLLIPIGLIALVSPWIGLAVLALLPHWLSNRSELRSVFLHNHVLAIPFLWLATIDGLRRVQKKFPRLTSWSLLGGLLCFGIVGTGLISAFPWSVTYHPNYFKGDSELSDFGNRIRALPSYAPVGYSLGLGQYVRNRLAAYRLPHGYDRIEYVVLFQQIGFTQKTAAARQQDALFQVMREYYNQSQAFEKVYSTPRGAIYHKKPGHIPEPYPRLGLQFILSAKQR